ncbi:MAG: hypothetical protein V4685_03005 [Bacteroidota bacterium]
MYALVHHQISDPEKFLAITQSEAKFPPGFEVLAFLPDVSHKSATCIWEAPDTTSLKNLLEPVLGNTSTNSYHQIDESIAQGLSKLKEAEMHA